MSFRIRSGGFVAALGLLVSVLAANPRQAEAQPSMQVGHVIRDAGQPFSMLGKGEAKAAWVDGAWWGVFTSALGVDLMRLQGTTWVEESAAGYHLTSDPTSHADVLYDGRYLLVLLNEQIGGVTALRLYVFTYRRPGFVPVGGFPTTVVSGGTSDPLEDDVHTLAEDSNGRLWIAYRADNSGAIKGSLGTNTGGWLGWSSPVLLGYLGNGVAEGASNGAIVAFGSGTTAAIGFMWSDQSAPPNNAYRFSFRLDSAASLTASDWSTPEVAYTNGAELVANDQLQVVGFEGKLFAIAKTDTTPTSATIGEDRFILMVRATDGTWTKTTVRTIEKNGDASTRPQLAIDGEHRNLYAFWHDLAINGMVTSVDAPSFLGNTLFSFIEPTATTCWDSQSSHQILSSRTGLLVLADDNDTGWQYSNLISLGTPEATNPVSTLSSITLTPSIAAVDTGGQVQFLANGFDQHGAAFPITPTWSADGGSIDSSGLYTAGATTGVFGVAATDSETGHATVFVGAAPFFATIGVTPDPATVLVSQTIQLQAVATTASGTVTALAPSAVTWSVSNGVGSVTTQGLFTAPATASQAFVEVQGLGLTGFGTVLVVTSLPVTTGGGGGGGGGGGSATTSGPLAKIVVTPSSASVVLDGSVGFSAQGEDAQGNAVTLTSVSWYATGGTIGTNGVYHAGNATGVYWITASENGVSGSTQVTITTAPATADPSSSSGDSGGGGGGGGGGGCALEVHGGAGAQALFPFLALILVVGMRRRLSPLG
jgi:hypothetical protein